MILPGFGVLMINRSSGRISFNSFVKYNDGLLVGHITEQEGCSEKEALDKVNTYIQEIHEKVEKNGQFEIEGVGTFSKTDSGKLTLEGKKMDINPKKGAKSEGESAEKSDNSDAKAQGPGPEKSSSSSAAQGAQTEQKKEEKKTRRREEKEAKKEEKKAEKEQKEKEEKKSEKKAEKKKEKAEKGEQGAEKDKGTGKKEKSSAGSSGKAKPSSQADGAGEERSSGQKKESRRRIAPLLIILLVILLIGGGGTGLWFSGWYEGPPFNWLGLAEEGEREKEEDADKEKPEKEKEAKGKGDKKVDTDSSGAKAGTEQKRGGDAKSDGKGSKSGDKARSNKQGGEKKASTSQGSAPAGSPDGNYHIIAGCFEYEQLADTLVKDLKKEGYNARKVGKTSGLTAVSADSYASREKAEQALKDFKGRQSDAWILKR